MSTALVHQGQSYTVVNSAGRTVATGLSWPAAARLAGSLTSRTLDLHTVAPKVTP